MSWRINICDRKTPGKKIWIQEDLVSDRTRKLIKKTYDVVKHLGDNAVAEVGLDFSLLRGGRFEDGCEEIHL